MEAKESSRVSAIRPALTVLLGKWWSYAWSSSSVNADGRPQPKTTWMTMMKIARTLVDSERQLKKIVYTQ